ncbi:TM0106 family RecB-like putative nuclease [Micrococcus sp. IITD107]|uniref:TM0106 family RecB-like putative nuclease n=1 Tax=Micrococcus sp. IITD107 TaxID=3342790 RepID=UPI0035B7E9D3
MFVDQRGRVVTSASDLTVASACEFSWLRQLDEKLGRLDVLERPTDAMLARTATLGDAHEEKVLTDYDDGSRTVARIERPNVKDPASLDVAVQATLQAFGDGADVVFQATFATDDDHGLPFVGFADFIVRQPDGRYRVQDTKLARSAKVTALLQLAAYAGRMRAAGVPVDDQVDLILGDGTVSTHRLKDIEPVYVLRRRRLAQMVAARLEGTEPVSWEDERYTRCGSCDDCAAQIEATGDMWQVYNLRSSQRAKLRSAGLRTMQDIADWNPGDPSGGVPRRTMERLSGQARLQIASAGLDQPLYEVIDPQLLATLPASSPGDIFFDFEGDPLWTPDGTTWGLDYLFGLVDAQGEFRAFWAHDLAEERQALLDFLDYVEAKRRAYPDMHIYHYAAYERTHLSSIAQRHGVGEERVDDLLRGQVLVDLYGLVGGALQLGTSSYSIKKVEALHMAGEVREGVTNAADSVDQYAQYVLLKEAGKEDEAEKLLQEIADYNEYDCISTLKLRDWLRQVALDAGALSSHPDDGRSPAETMSPEPVETEEERLKRLAREERAQERDDLEAAAFSRAGDRFSPDRTDEERAWGLAGAALRFHEREGKSFWWEHFTRLSEPVDEWSAHRNVFHVESAEVIRGWSKATSRARTLSRDLKLRGEWSEGSTPGSGGAFLVYEFPGPALMYGADSGMRDAMTATITDVEPGVIVVTESTSQKPPVTHDTVPTAVTPGTPPRTGPLEDVIEEWVTNAVHAGRLPEDPLGDLLRRSPSRLNGGALAEVEDEDYVSVVTMSALRLNGSYLAVQGPPGTGKTYVASHVIIQLVRDHGWTVGVVAQSHKVVDNVLAKVVAHGLDPDLVGKAQTKGRELPAGVVHEYTNSKIEEFVRAHQDGCVIGGTAWAFAALNKEKVKLDLLVVDEAGQYSLANTIAAGACARNLLLFGDPQQLPQVSQGSHPESVDTSALGFLSQGHDVLPGEFGYFLAQSRRMDAEVTAPVSELSYEGELRAHETTKDRSVEGVAPGLETVFVEHAGNVGSSTEEAEVVVGLVRRHLGQSWNAEGTSKTLCEDDVIVVTPYNAQVQALRSALDSAGLTGVRAGTVDKFQGQEAVISITSLAASSAADVPRGLSFLLMRNRLNVSISRAKWKAYLVCSPALLDHLPNTPQALAEMSAFAQLVAGGQTKS